jgi:hypothetical protein
MSIELPRVFACAAFPLILARTGSYAAFRISEVYLSRVRDIYF